MTIAVYLLLLAIAVGWLSNRVRIPYPILLVLAGIAVGFLPQARSIYLQPDLLLAAVLPAALYPLPSTRRGAISGAICGRFCC